MSLCEVMAVVATVGRQCTVTRLFAVLMVAVTLYIYFETSGFVGYRYMCNLSPVTVNASKSVAVWGGRGREPEAVCSQPTAMAVIERNTDQTK